MTPLRRLHLAAFSLLGVVITTAVTCMIIGISIEVVEFVLSPSFVIPAFIAAWLIVPRIFDR